MKRLGIYIHWPFCRSKCPYCDFFSQVKKNINQADLVDEYLQDLEYYKSLSDDYQVDTVFFGGGTPSLMEPAQISRIIDKIAKLWPMSDNPEISLEANPNTDHNGMFEDLRHAGINRLSLGVQALNDADLKFLGRTHNLSQALSSIENIQECFDNHSIDIIYARPEQTAPAWEKELQQVASLGMKHLSLYQLTIEEGTYFARKGIKAMEEEKAAELYELSSQIIRNYGYHQYEISNYAQSGFECRHNLGYWHGDDYVGVGKGAVGYLHIDDKIVNTTHKRQLEVVSAHDRAEELVIMGLRLNEGLDKNRFYQSCGLKWENFANQKKLKELNSENLIEENENSVKVTFDGRLLLNYVIEQICL